MKRIIAAILFLVSLFSASACSHLPIREYKGSPLTKLIFKSVNYNGGYTTVHYFDFEENVLKHLSYLPLGNTPEPDFEIIAEFSDEEEIVLVNKLYSYGLFSIKENYPQPPNIVDGSGWDLTICFNDGTVKKSVGSNNSPRSVFKNCAKAFYDICDHGIVGYVPPEYYSPPDVSYSFGIKSGDYGYMPHRERADYKWNGKESSGNDIYEINENITPDLPLDPNGKYTFGLYTANYGKFSDYKRFSKCTVTCYDYNRELTNGKTVLSEGWFKQVDFDLELNKIYVIRLDFKNGDFVEYTFNTKTD